MTESFINKCFHWTLMTVLTISTFFYCAIPSDVIQAAQQTGNADPITQYALNAQILFLRYGISVLFAISLLLNPLRKIIVKEISFLFLFVIAISIFISFDVQQRSSILNLFMFMVFLKIIAEHFDFKYLKPVCWTMFGILTANLVFCVLQKLNIDPLFYHTSSTVVGFPHPPGLMRLEAHLGVLTALCSPFLFIISPWLALISLPLLFWGKASAAVGTFLASSLFILYFKVKRRYFWMILIGLLAASAFYIWKFDMPGGNFGRRFEVWGITIREALRKSPYFGFGLGKFALFQPQTKQLTNEIPLSWTWAHNEYVQMFFECGAIGIIAVIFYIKARIREFIKLRLGSYELKCIFAAFITVLLISVIHFPFHIARLAGISIFILSIYQAKVIDEEQKKWTLKELEQPVCSD